MSTRTTLSVVEWESFTNLTFSLFLTTERFHYLTRPYCVPTLSIITVWKKLMKLPKGKLCTHFCWAFSWHHWHLADNFSLHKISRISGADGIVGANRIYFQIDDPWILHNEGVKTPTQWWSNPGIPFGVKRKVSKKGKNKWLNY